MQKKVHIFQNLYLCLMLPFVIGCLSYQPKYQNLNKVHHISKTALCLKIEQRFGKFNSLLYFQLVVYKQEQQNNLQQLTKHVELKTTFCLIFCSSLDSKGFEFSLESRLKFPPPVATKVEKRSPRVSECSDVSTESYTSIESPQSTVQVNSISHCISH